LLIKIVLPVLAVTFQHEIYSLASMLYSVLDILDVKNFNESEAVKYRIGDEILMAEIVL
jgi:hypothetical protein